MSRSRGAERLFNYPRLYRAKFVITGAVLKLARPLMFRTFVGVDDVIDAAAIRAGSQICEIGCGDGENYRTVRRLAGAVRYTGIDINAKMIDHCRTNFPEQRWLCASLPYPFPDRQFDYCIIVNVLHHLDGRDQVVAMLREAGRIARTVALFEPLQSENAVLAAIKRLYWGLTDGGHEYPRLAAYRSLFVRAGVRIAWERFSSPLRHFYGALLCREA